MKKSNFKSMVFTVVCFFFVSGLLTGCTSTKNFLGYLKFWGANDAVAIKSMEPKEMSAFFSEVRSARGNPDSHYLLATQYQLRGRHREALDEFRKVIMIDPQYAKAYNGMGVSYDNLREFDKAQEAYTVVMRLAPQQEYVYNNLGYSLVLKGDYAAAVEVLQKGITLNQNNEQMHNNLAMAYAAMGKNDRALAELEQTNRPAEAQFALAQIHQQQGRLEDAETFFTAATSLDPSLKRAMPDKDRFVAQVTRSLKEARQAKLKPAKEDQALVKTLNRPVKEAKRVVSPKRIAKVLTTIKARSFKTVALRTRTFQIVHLEISKLEPDFLMNKTAPAGGDTDSVNNTQKTIDGPSAELVRELFPVRYVKDTATPNRVTGRQIF